MFIKQFIHTYFQGFFKNVGEPFYASFELVVCTLVEYLKPVVKVLLDYLEFTGSSNMLAFGIMFIVGAFYDMLVYGILKLGFSLNQSKNPYFQTLRFWFGYFLPTFSTLILSALGFWLMFAMDFNCASPISLLACPWAVVFVLIFLGHHHLYLKNPLGTTFTIIQASCIILSDIIAGVLAFNGWSFSILIVIAVNMVVTFFAYAISHMWELTYVEHLNACFLKKMTQILTYLKLTRIGLNSSTKVETSYAYAMYGVLFSSKMFLWVAGAFFGPYGQFSNNHLGFFVCLVLGFIWISTSLRLLYYAALSVSSRKQRLILPWEIGIAFQLSPATY